LQCGQNFLFQSQGLLVHDEKIGLKGFGGGGDNIFADIQGMPGVDFD